MLFNSLAYAVFLPLAVLFYFLVPQRWRWVALLGFSYYFYMSWNPELIVLILFTTVVSWLAALAVERTRRPALRKAALWGGVGLCLACLFFFKYFNFFSQNVTALLQAVGLPLQPTTLELVLPVGISFYTFQTLSYVVDVYRGDLKAEHHFGYYALYVSFFPQLVAGPIERAGNLLPQLHEKHDPDLANFSAGLRKICVGMFKKVVIADFVATYVNNVYNDLAGKGGLTLILATMLFSVQIYCDFSGYSDIAVGSARLLGINLMENFRSPYMARSVKDFWRRWHISLTRWFTDYVYIPLGGSRCSRWKHLRNLVVTFLLSGLWHGASWTFVLWGVYHGLWLCAETFYLPRVEALQNRLQGVRSTAFAALRTVLTCCVVGFGWIFFRANDLSDLTYVLTHLGQGLNPVHLLAYAQAAGLTPVLLGLAFALIAALLVYDWYATYRTDPLRAICRARPWQRYTFYYVLCFGVLAALCSRPFGATADFIYFQF
nr:MBOAT family O-acyltransferase [uncultured Gemmiger sp.]